MKILTSFLLIWISALAQANTCPDGNVCTDDQTCCLLVSGSYSCCPLPNAVCCEDGEHCCPEGYNCDKGLCYLVTSTPTNSSDITCPGGKFNCPDGDTCCPAGEAFTCCPLPNASCCPDGAHCCPESTTCDLAHQTCNTPEAVVEAALINKRSNDVICPGGEYQCPDGSTCCLLSTGGYGCCPLPSAVCCDDGVHCCPTGYNCSGGECTKGEIGSEPQIKSQTLLSEAALINTRSNDVICPGGEYQCPDGSTCCLLSTGGYGCCPLPSAVCCDDGVHCCPNGYNCSGGECTKGEVGLEHKIKSQTLLSEGNKVVNHDEFLNNSVVCPDGHSQCPNGNTCCMLNSGTYGCCPLSLATCCLDHIHCCPHGSQCYTYGTCTALGENLDNPLVVPWVRKVPAIPRGNGHVHREGYEDENNL